MPQMCYKLTIESTSPVPPQTKISRWNRKWNEIGRELGVHYDYRQQLFKKCSPDEDRLEDVLQRWIQSESVPVTWSSLISALEAVDHKDVAREVKDFLRTFK